MMVFTIPGPITRWKSVSAAYSLAPMFTDAFIAVAKMTVNTMVSNSFLIFCFGWNIG